MNTASELRIDNEINAVNNVFNFVLDPIEQVESKNIVENFENDPIPCGARCSCVCCAVLTCVASW
jgi:ferredoxin